MKRPLTPSPTSILSSGRMPQLRPVCQRRPPAQVRADRGVAVAGASGMQNAQADQRVWGQLRVAQRENVVSIDTELSGVGMDVGNLANHLPAGADRFGDAAADGPVSGGRTGEDHAFDGIRVQSLGVAHCGQRESQPDSFNEVIHQYPSVLDDCPNACCVTGKLALA